MDRSEQDRVLATSTRRSGKLLAACATFAGVVASVTVIHYVSAQTTTTITTISAATAGTYHLDPVTQTGGATPLVMLTLSRDHQLHYKAYNDYSDLNGDGTIETTYSGPIDYYGYFDPTKCYTYDTANGRFNPAAMATIGSDNGKSCSGQWSGNFLNWASMTRMDAMRKLLYGGYRSTDTAALTVLERDYLPSDAHAFAKYYNGSDIAQLTPFTGVPTSATAYSNVPGGISSTIYAAVNVSSITRSSGTATVTTAASHNYITGETVLISATCNSAYNGIRTSITRLSNTTFSYAVSGTPGNCTTAGGTTQLVLPITPTASAPLALGDQLSIVRDNNNFMSVVVTSLLNGSASAINSATSGPVYVQMTSGTSDTSIISVTGSGNTTSLTVTDLNTSGISFCNVTRGATSGANQRSQTNTNPPLLKVAVGNFILWGANERSQCNWYGDTGIGGRTSDQQGTFGGGLLSNGNRAPFSGLPASAENPIQAVHGRGAGSLTTGGTLSTGEFVVRVQACASGLEGTERCETYPNGNEKPIGLLHVYGETGRINFGLLTPTYGLNISGGVVRKQISSFANEVNAGTDGTFLVSSGIVSNINRLRIYNYDYNDGGYQNADNCTYQLTGLVTSGGANSGGGPQTQGNCVNWGNPIGEAYVESLRYLAGGSPDSRFAQAASGPDATLGLTTVSSWTDPLNSVNYCASLNVLAFNASVSSYDDDQTDRLSNLFGSPSAAAQTNAVGVDEGISGRNWFVGATSGILNGYCDSKTIANLGTATGICPESPTLKGSYLMDGAAFYAHTNRIRDPAPLSVPTSDTSSLKVDTYGIQLATNTPKIVIPIPNSTRTVTILPIYRLSLGNGGSGTLVDFRVVAQDKNAGTGTFYVNWEDSAQGGDYDQDEWGTIRYSVDTVSQTIRVTTDAIAASTANGQGFGYIISGTSKDGPHFHSGIYGFSYADPSNVQVYDANTNAALNSTTPYTNSSDAGGSGGIGANGGCNNCAISNPPTYVTYSITGTSAGLLQDPLYYAAKYGGFDEIVADSNHNNIPDVTDEWDAKKQNGSAGSDGLPDQYFYVNNPGALETSLATAFNTILQKTSSGTAAAVVANQREGEGAIYQAIFETSRSDSAGNTAQWLGTVQSLFIDAAGNLREDDSMHSRTLNESDFSANPAVAVFYDTADRTTKVRRYTCNPNSAGCTTFSIDRLENLNTLWNAREALAGLSNSQVTTNRVYKNSAGTGRYIFTYVDKNLNGVVDNTEQVTFASGSFSGMAGLLNVADDTSASTLINYTRGQDYTGLRNRTINYNGTGSKTYRLGDVVNSSPTAVGTPAEAYDLLYNDTTYATFRKKYQLRRNVIYVGANDGMLHAFNGGFYDANLKRFQTTPIDGGAATAHPLGSELWGYVPFNLLPHLGWLTASRYSHVFYFDGTPRVFDARIFPDDPDHPGGWGTVLVAGMRFGGGDLRLPASNCTYSAAFSGFTVTGSAARTCTSPTRTVPNNDINTHSAYVVMDITNPEGAPTVLAEIGTNPSVVAGDFGFTTSYPSALAFSAKGGSTSDNWYLTLGNGPTDLSTAAVSTSAKLNVYRLTTGAPTLSRTLTLATNSFTGDPVAVDWDLDFKADVLYVGTASGTPLSPTGQLVKIDTKSLSDTSQWTASVLTNPAMPVLATPAVALDNADRRWVYAGTGRLFVGTDKSNAVTQQSLFGVIDSAATPDFSGLLDVTNARVKVSDSSISGVGTATTETVLETSVQAARGWKILLSRPASTSSPSSAERVLSSAGIVGSTLFSSAYTPDTSLCTGTGNSRLFGVNFITGVANSAVPALGTYTASNVQYYYNSVDLGAGLGAAPSLHADNTANQTAGGNGMVTVVTQTSTGSIVTTNAQVAPGERSGEIDWRETLPN